jgi:hypothetical protein
MIFVILWNYRPFRSKTSPFISRFIGVDGGFQATPNITVISTTSTPQVLKRLSSLLLFLKESCGQTLYEYNAYWGLAIGSEQEIVALVSR